MAIPALAATLALSAACNQASTPADEVAGRAGALEARRGEARRPEAGGCPARRKPAGKSYPSPPSMSIDQNKTYTAVIKTSLGEMTAELYPKDAPNTVNNFVFLSREGFYNGVIFHRIIKEFMVQTGDPTGHRHAAIPATSSPTS